MTMVYFSFRIKGTLNLIQFAWTLLPPRTGFFPPSLTRVKFAMVAIWLLWPESYLSNISKMIREAILKIMVAESWNHAHISCI